MKTNRQMLSTITVFMLLILNGCDNDKYCDKPWMIPGETQAQKEAEFLKRCPEQAKASAELRAGTFKKSQPREW